jgi:hypothetical protein
MDYRIAIWMSKANTTPNNISVRSCRTVVFTEGHERGFINSIWASNWPDSSH